ncbi:GH36-type glycosyl hydrolase domain-containing protein [Spirochaeta dissipatitropha]
MKSSTEKNRRTKSNGQFCFSEESSVRIRECSQDKTREPWLMLLARRNQKPTSTLCWGLTNSGTTFARIGTQEGDILNGFVHEDPYKARLLGPYTYFVDSNDNYFTNTWYPVMHEDQKLETEFNFGSVVYRTSYKDLRVETSCFIPNEFDALVQIIKLKNESETGQKFRMYSINPINIGDARDIQFSGFNTLMMGGARIDREIDALVWRNSFGIPFADNPDTVKGMFGKLAVHVSSLSGCSFSSRYEEFVGHFSDSLACPAALFEGPLPDRDAEELTSALSALQNEVCLAPGEEKEIVVALLASSTEDYYRNGKKELKKHLEAIRDPERVKAMYAAVRKDWEEDIARLKLHVPEDNLFNDSFKWLQYQCAMVAILNRMKSRYHSGFEYGYGFRDILQDLLALLPTNPVPARDLIAFTACQMFSDGSVYHNFFVSAKGNRDFQACDDPLWLIYAVCEYVKETGDTAFLDEVHDFADSKEGLPARSGTIMEHCIAAVERVWKNSDNGLPLMMDADWNDDLSSYPQHRSVMAAQMLFKALNEMIQLFEVVDTHADLLNGYRQRAETVRNSVESRCVDPEGHYIRALAPDPATQDLGSSRTDKLVFLEPIAWSSFSGLADKKRFDVLKKTVEDNLDDKYGISLCQGDRGLADGALPLDYSAWKRNAPGKKENGGQFRHLESWYMASLCLNGYGNEAWEVCRKTLPAVASSHDPYNYAAERFVYPEYVSGSASNDHGKAGHTWLTGTAPTRLGMIVEYIFGIRRVYNGLLIDPCVHESWREFRAERLYRGTRFRITYKNPDGVQKGVVSILVDGQPVHSKTVKGQVIPAACCDGGDHQVEVLMGEVNENR